MHEQLVAWVRTVVPSAWAALVAYALAHGVPGEVGEALAGLGPALVAVCVAVVYALARLVESSPHVPDLVKRLLLGSTKQPVYNQNKHYAEEA